MFKSRARWFSPAVILFATALPLSSTLGQTSPYFNRVNPVGARSDAFRVVTAPDHPVRYGMESQRFEAGPGDCGASETGRWDDCKRDRERTELLEYGESYDGSKVWYRWSIFIPEGHVNIFPTKLTYGQFFQAPCKRRPAFMFAEFDGGYWYWMHSHVRGYREVIQLLEPDEFIGKWNDIVVQAHWSSGDDGFLKVFVNGRLKADYEGHTFTKTGGHGGKVCNAMKFKYGVYRAFVSRSDKSSGTTTVVYYDGVRKGDSKEGMFGALPE